MCTLEDGIVTSARIGEPSLMVSCQREHPALHLTATGMVAFILGTTRRALVDELILLQQAQLARQLSSLNDWDQQTLNSHQLGNALRFRQLDNVDAVLQDIPPRHMASAAQILLETIEDASKLAKGFEFSQQLLYLAIKYLARAIAQLKASGRADAATTDLTDEQRGQRDAVRAEVQHLAQIMLRLRVHLIRPKNVFGGATGECDHAIWAVRNEGFALMFAVAVE